MNKSIWVLLLLFFSPVIYFSCIKYAFWQTVPIPDGGTFKVPRKWTITQRENSVYITDKPIEEDEYTIYLVGMKRNNALSYHFSDFAFFENAVYIETEHYKIFSNSASCGVEKYNINGEIEEKYTLEFFCSTQNKNPQTFHLLVWDNAVKEKTVIKIAKSYALLPSITEGV